MVMLVCRVSQVCDRSTGHPMGGTKQTAGPPVGWLYTKCNSARVIYSRFARSGYLLGAQFMSRMKASLE